MDDYQKATFIFFEPNSCSYGERFILKYMGDDNIYRELVQ